MHWADGYPVSERYLDTLQPNMAPARIDLALLVSGCMPPSDGKTFRYVELGCGSGVSLAVFASLYQEAEFIGYDFLPEHIARARNLSEEAQLTNLHFEEASFEDLVTAPSSERVDYIALHGVWTWVSETSQRVIVEFIKRNLKPGGVVYIAYNAAAGWGAASAIRRIFLESPPGNPDAPLGPARAAIDAWLAIASEPRTQALWKRLAALPDRYLKHEFLALHGTAAWPTEVAVALEPAKLNFVGPADLYDVFDALRFTGKSLEFVSKAAASGWGETARDIASAQTFRCDIFSRGAPRLPEAELHRRLSELRIAPWPPRLEVERENHRERSQRNFDPKIARRVEAALSSGEQSLGEFVASLDLSERQGFQAAFLSLARGDSMLVYRAGKADPAIDAARRLNAVAGRRWHDGAPLPGIAVPRLATGLGLSKSEQEVLFGSAKASPELAEWLERLSL